MDKCDKMFYQFIKDKEGYIESVIMLSGQAVDVGAVIIDAWVKWKKERGELP